MHNGEQSITKYGSTYYIIGMDMVPTVWVKKVNESNVTSK